MQKCVPNFFNGFVLCFFSKKVGGLTESLEYVIMVVQRYAYWADPFSSFYMNFWR